MASLTFVDACVIAVALAACVTDLRWARIPNLLTITAALAAIAWHAWSAGAAGVGESVAGLALGLLIWMPLYAIGGIGAGDLKLLAAFGAWLGAGDTLRVALASAMVGAILALAVALRHGYLARAWTHVKLALVHWHLEGLTPVPGLTLAEASGPRLAYAVPMLAGVLVTLWLR